MAIFFLFNGDEAKKKKKPDIVHSYILLMLGWSECLIVSEYNYLGKGYQGKRFAIMVDINDFP